MAARTDEKIREELLEIDKSDSDVSTWEADFIESVCFKNKDRPLTAKQVEAAENIIERYT